MSNRWRFLTLSLFILGAIHLETTLAVDSNRAIKNRCAQIKLQHQRANEATRLSIEIELDCLNQAMKKPESERWKTKQTKQTKQMTISECKRPILEKLKRRFASDQLIDALKKIKTAQLGVDEGESASNRAVPCMTQGNDQGDESSTQQGAVSQSVPSMASLLKMNSVSFSQEAVGLPELEPGDLVLSHQFYKRVYKGGPSAPQGKESNLLQHTGVVIGRSKKGETVMQHVGTTGLNQWEIRSSKTMQILRPEDPGLIRHLTNEGRYLAKQPRKVFLYSHKKMVSSFFTPGRERKDLRPLVYQFLVAEYQDFLAQRTQENSDQKPVLPRLVQEEICSSFLDQKLLVAAMQSKVDAVKKYRDNLRSSWEAQLKKQGHQGDSPEELEKILQNRAEQLLLDRQFVDLMEFPSEWSSGSPIFRVLNRDAILPNDLIRGLLSESESACEPPKVGEVLLKEMR